MVAELKMNQEKLKMLQAQVRIGGKGTVRRKKKVVHRTATTDDKKLQSSLKKLSGVLTLTTRFYRLIGINGDSPFFNRRTFLVLTIKSSVNNIPGIEEVNMIKDDGTVIHFNNPKVGKWWFRSYLIVVLIISDFKQCFKLLNAP